MSLAPPTERGRATRERIVRAAAQLVNDQGSAATSIDDVIAATSASKSQLYHYFGDKHGLIEAVVDYQSAAVLGFHARTLAAVDSWEDFDRWADAIVDTFERQGARGGCPIGTLAAALADTDEPLRELLDDAFRTWRHAISGALVRLREHQLLAQDADIEQLTTTMLAAIQGGLLLGKTTRDSGPLRTALEGAIAHLRAHAPAPPKRRPRRSSASRAS
jgi:AcrR family transcriptional regulator